MNLSPDSLDPDGKDVSFLYMAPFLSPSLLAGLDGIHHVGCKPFPMASIFTARFYFVRTAILYVL